MNGRVRSNTFKASSTVVGGEGLPGVIGVFRKLQFGARSWLRVWASVSKDAGGCQILLG